MNYIEDQVFYDTVEIDSNTIVQACDFYGGVILRGDNITFRMNGVYESDTAITIYGQTSTVTMNNIQGFSVDGIRILNSYNAVTENIIQGSIEGNPDNHNDGIQIWSDYKNKDNEIHGLNVSRNKLYLSSAEVSTQGIIATDCVVTDSLFEDNFVDVNHWHGITLNSAEGNQITGNVIQNQYGDPERVPWVKIFEDLGNNLVQNNTVPSVVPSTHSSDNRLVQYKQSSEGVV